MADKRELIDALVNDNWKNCQLFLKPFWNAIQMIVVFFVTTYRWWPWVFISYVF